MGRAKNDNESVIWEQLDEHLKEWNDSCEQIRKIWNQSSLKEWW
jgi:hypothetical protein